LSWAKSQKFRIALSKQTFDRSLEEGEAAEFHAVSCKLQWAAAALPLHRRAF